MKRYLLAVLISLLGFLSVEAQFVTTNQTIQQYIQNTLVGEGVEVSNISVNVNCPEAIGEFNDFGMTPLGLTHGIVVSTGNVNDVTNAYNTLASSNNTPDGTSDADLNALSSVGLNDELIIEFDFIPLSDEISFNYVFASEEIPNYCGSDYNDVFAFFITGPNPDGGTYQSTNIAQLPGLNLPVTINNICNNPQFKISNESAHLVYKTLTPILTAYAKVVPCQTYHIKLAIADAGDSSWDSAFFLQAYSFSSTALDYEIVPHSLSSYNGEPRLDTLIEGCTSVDVIFEIEEPFDNDSTLLFTEISGTAEQGVDYESLPEGITFEAGQTRDTIHIVPLLDENVNELIENIFIKFQTSPCTEDSLSFYIENVKPPLAQFTYTPSICLGEHNEITFTGESSDKDTIIWNFSGGNLVSNNEDVYDVLFVEPGEYPVSLAVNRLDGCFDSNTQHNISVKQNPSNKFFINGSICSGGETTVCYVNDNDPEIPCGGDFLHWTFDEGLTVTPTATPCCYTISAVNNTDNAVYFPISLYAEYEGCVSAVRWDSLKVLPPDVEFCCEDPTANAGNNAIICGLDYALQAQLEGSGNHGQWLQMSGPSVIFPNNDKGTAIEAGNPNALIHASEPGVVVMKWIEYSGECSDEAFVEITFIEQPQVTFPTNPINVCDNSTSIEVQRSIYGSTLEWSNPEGTTISSTSVFNPTVTTNTLPSSHYFVVKESSSGGCYDIDSVLVNFKGLPNPYAGPDNTVCGKVDTLNAFLEAGFTGHWEVANQPSDGVNCSAIFLNHETDIPDIYDPKAVVKVSCTGEWIFKWIVENQSCSASDEVKVTFNPSTIEIVAAEQIRTCLDYAHAHVDTTGFSTATWHWNIDTTWAQQHPHVKLIFNAYDPFPVIQRDFSSSAFGDNGYITIPMQVSLYNGTCLSVDETSVTFYQRPQPYLGRDTAVCASEKAFNVLPTIPTDISEAVWIQDSQTQYDVTNETGYNTVVSANPGDSIPIIFSEENTLGNDHPSCLVTDTIWVDFLKRPIADAGDDEYHVCGNAIQLEARLDESLNSIGRWLIHTGGFFGYSEGDNDPTAVKDTNAWFYHSTAINPGIDTLYLHWREFNAKSAQCFSEDSVPIHFWYKDTAYIKLNGTSSLVDSTCGQVYTGISGNDNMPTNQWSKGTWKTEDGSSVEWFKDGQNGQYNSPQLDSIKIGTIGEQNANIWREIYWEIGNGYINGDQPPVCYDRSEAVKIRFDNLVYANIVESANYPKPLYNCGDTLVLSAGDKKPWSHFQWLPNNYTYMNLAGTPNTDQADTLDNPVIVAPSNIYPNTDTSLTGDNAYRQLHLKVSNGMCVAYDTINVTFAPIPTGEFTVNKPACANQAARLTVKKDNLTGFNVHLTDIEWFFEDGDEPTSVVYTNPDVKDTADIIWGNSAENNDYKHAVSLKVTNYWGCSFQKFPPDTVFEPLPSYVELQKAKPTTCGECNGYVSVINKSNISKYTIEWAGDEAFENIIKNNELDTLASDTLNEVCDGRYFLRISYQSATGLNCQDTMSFNILPNPSTIAMSEFAFNADTSDLQAPVALGELLSNTSSNANKYQWQVFSGTTDDLSLLLNESTANVPDFSLVNAGEYHIKLQALNDKAPNCAVLPYSVTIYVEYESTLAVPNVFTPNGDGINEEFKVKAQSITDYKCIIYNRWGTKMFETTDPSESWNGKVDNNGSEANPGPYFYVITAKSKKTGDEIKKEGALQLVR